MRRGRILIGDDSREFVSRLVLCKRICLIVNGEEDGTGILPHPAFDEDVQKLGEGGEGSEEEVRI